jgi:hypothetical protein
MHTPPLQEGVGAGLGAQAAVTHRRPQAPQLLASLERLTHAPPQLVVPFGQQMPPEL